MLRNPIDRYGLVLLVAVTAAGYLGGIRPVLVQQTEKLLAERSVSKKQDKLDELNAQRDELDGRVQTLGSTIDGYRGIFTASSQENARIGEVADLANLVGVSVEAIRPGEVIQTEGFRALPITISGSGEPDLVGQFLSRLRQAFPDMGARNLSVSAQGDEASSLALDLVWFMGDADRADRNDPAQD